MLCCLTSGMHNDLSCVPVFKYESILAHLIAASICHHQWMCTIVYFEGFVWNPPVFHSAAALCYYSLWGKHGWQSSTLQAVCSEYYLWCSDWLKLLRWLTARTLYPTKSPCQSHTADDSLSLLLFCCRFLLEQWVVVFLALWVHQMGPEMKKYYGFYQ